MAIVPRSFGEPPHLSAAMERGHTFFEAINNQPIDYVLDRSKRISRIALTAAAIAGETLQLAGDGDSKRLIYAAYLSIGDIVERIAIDASPDIAEKILTSPTTHETILYASRTFKSKVLDDMSMQFKSQGAWFTSCEEGLLLRDDIVIPDNHLGKGCPYAMGNSDKSKFFTECSDNIVRTYTEAHRRNMPKNLIGSLARKINSQ